MTENDYTVPNKSNSALIIIDVQKDFSMNGAPAEIPGTVEVIGPIQNLIKKYREKGKPIVHVIRLYQSDGSNVDLCRKKVIEDGKQMVIVGTDGSEIVNDLKPSSTTKLNPGLLLSGKMQKIGKAEWVLYKPRWGAFYKTNLEEHLRKMGIDTLVICGCNFPNCPRTTIYEASDRDFKIVFIKDGTSRVYDIGLKELENIGVSIMDTGEFVCWISAN
jgi:nicotinamidase-related amidase